MRILGNLASQNRSRELLANIDVESDDAVAFHQWDQPAIKRRITGTIRRYGELWDEFVGLWGTLRLHILSENGREHFVVRQIQIDHDYYAFDSWLWADGGSISIIVLESFEGPVDEYKAHLKQRNERIQGYLDKLDRGRVTRNEVREWMGFERGDQPFLDEYIPAELVSKLREMAERDALDKRNVII